MGRKCTENGFCNLHGVGGRGPNLAVMCSNSCRGSTTERRMISPWLENGRVRFRRVRFQTLSSLSFLALAEFQGESSVSSSRPTTCVPKRTHRVLCRPHRVCADGTALLKQYSARFQTAGKLHQGVEGIRGRRREMEPVDASLCCLTSLRKAQEGCGCLGGEIPAFLKAGPIFQQPFSFAGIWPGKFGPQILAGIAIGAAGKSGKSFAAASKCAGGLPARNFRTATVFSSFLRASCSDRVVPHICDAKM